jgi:hypothetical protein
VWLDFPGIAFARPDEASAGGLGEVARMSPEITLDKLGDRIGKPSPWASHVRSVS